VINAPCHVLNSGGIDNAKDSRRRAEQHRDWLRSRLNTLINEKNQFVAQRHNLHQQKNALEQRKIHLQNEINILSTQRNGAVAMNQKIKSVILHMETVFNRSVQLKNAIYNLIGMNEIKAPLEFVANSILTYTTDGNDVHFFNNVKNVVNNGLKVLRPKLDQYPLIDIQL